ncbi:MAG: KH domain-containing protein [Ruminococcaceae bacterium]|nr:KH domain-containing protein [Oscillospiraceae bacterium]MBR5515574.1 KH domain-containing protein [Clostridia bacterium]
MADFKTILADMVKPIVVYPDEVVITEEEKGDTVTLTLNVNPSDMGKVIGKHGKIARSLRLIMKAAATQCGKKVNVDIR